LRSNSVTIGSKNSTEISAQSNTREQAVSGVLRRTL
jgi:hypothetical protein